MPKILLAMTGSVASVLADKMIPALQEVGEVKVMMSEAALRFANPMTLHKRHAVDVFTLTDEWSFISGNTVETKKEFSDTYAHSTDGWNPSGGGFLWQKNHPILHIELRDWADALVVAPLSANTLAKMACGICDTLPTAVFRAWDKTKPVVVAPAMNTLMWDDEITDEQLELLELRLDAHYPCGEPFKFVAKNFYVVEPQSKRLACGQMGMGALAPIDEIASTVKESLQWVFPLQECNGIPEGHHPGAFAFHRHKAHHTGVDLYTKPYAEVRAVEGGVVVGIQGFTGAKVGMEWWNDTDAVLIEGRSGVVNYGEILPEPHLQIGDRVRKGQVVGQVVPVVKEGRERPDVPGHSRWMLHFELYPHGITEWTSWPLGVAEHSQLDPTELLKGAIGAPNVLPQFEGEL